MPVFVYKAVAESNEVVEGEMEAPTGTAVLDRLRAHGQLPLYASEIQSTTQLLRRLTTRRVSTRDVTFMTQELATLLKAGVELDRALEILIDLCDKDATRSLLNGILARLRSGVSLADAVEESDDVFPLYYASMVRAGEASGALDVVLGRLAEFLGEIPSASRDREDRSLLSDLLDDHGVLFDRRSAHGRRAAIAAAVRKRRCRAAGVDKGAAWPPEISSAPMAG